jgi:hypothetical protein
VVNFVVSQEKGIEVSASDLIAFVNKAVKFEITDLASIAALAGLFSSAPPATVLEPQYTTIKTAFMNAGVKF